jgi:hypothetical protein
MLNRAQGGPSCCATWVYERQDTQTVPGWPRLLLQPGFTRAIVWKEQGGRVDSQLSHPAPSVRGRLPLQKPLAGPGCQSNRGYPAFT